MRLDGSLSEGSGVVCTYGQLTSSWAYTMCQEKFFEDHHGSLKNFQGDQFCRITLTGFCY